VRKVSKRRQKAERRKVYARPGPAFRQLDLLATVEQQERARVAARDDEGERSNRLRGYGAHSRPRV